MTRGSRRLAEQITGAQAALPTAAERAIYWELYGPLIRALKKAGTSGITLDQAMELCPALAGAAEDIDVLWTILGRVSGAVSNRWLSVSEVGVWWVWRPYEGGRVVINMQRSLFPWFTGEVRLALPAESWQVLAHFGHTHPWSGVLEASRQDLRTLMNIADRFPSRQPDWLILAGPTGQWRELDLTGILAIIKRMRQ
jgi:hypothetical protein